MEVEDVCPPLRAADLSDDELAAIVAGAKLTVVCWIRFIEIPSSRTLSPPGGTRDTENGTPMLHGGGISRRRKRDSDVGRLRPAISTKSSLPIHPT